MECSWSQLQQNLHDAIGTAVIYKVEDSKLLPLLYTKDAPRFSGLSEEEYLQLYGQDTLPVVAKGDLAHLLQIIGEVLAGKGSRAITYRTYHKTRGFVWTHVILRLLGTFQKLPVLIGTFTNVSDTISATNHLLDNTNQLVYVVERESRDLLYANAVALANKAIPPFLGQTCYQYIRGLGKPCPDCIANQLQGNAPLETEWYDHARHKTYSVRAVSLNFFGKDSIAFFINDLSKQVQILKEEQSRFNETLQTLLAANPNALCSFQVNLSQNTCTREHGASTYILNLLHSDTVDGLFTNLLSIIPECRQRIQAQSIFNRPRLLQAFAGGSSNLSLDYQRLNEMQHPTWVRTYIKMLQDPKSRDIIAIFSSLDISSEKRREQIFKIFTSEEFDFVALIHVRERQLEFLNLSYKLHPKYLHALGTPGRLYDFEEMRQFGLKTWIAKEDRETYLKASDLTEVKKGLDKSGHYEISVRGHYAGHPEEFMCRKVQHYYLDESKNIILIIQSDVTETYLQQQKFNIQQKKELTQSILDTLGRLPSISVLYQIVDGEKAVPLRYSDEFCRLKGCTQDNIRAFNSEDSFAPVHPADREELKKHFLPDATDLKPHKAIYRIRTRHRGYIWVSVNYTAFIMEKQHYLYAVYTDINDLKKQEYVLQEKYNAAQAFLDSVAGTYMATHRINLTQNLIEMHKSTELHPEIEIAPTYDAAISLLLKRLPRQQDRATYAKILGRDNLLKAYAAGNTHITLDYQALLKNGALRWVRSVNNLTKRPDNGDIICFNAVSDVTQEKLTEIIINQLVSKQYDYLACLDANHGTVAMFIFNKAIPRGYYPKPGTPYEPAMRAYNKKFLLAADEESCTRFMSLTNMVQSLKTHERCQRSIIMKENGQLRTKQLEFFYADRSSNLIALVRTDTTETQRQHLEQEAKLQAALTTAQHANHAKSEFLSRMSHDIRTPLNGIIGMTYLTSKLSLSPQAQSNLAKINTSSQFLLSLINDVLDMAKAESGRIELHPEPYTAPEFFKYLDAVIVPLCHNKQQELIIDAQPLVEFTPLMDKLRINQIFFNLLSNASKYAPAGSKITYCLREQKLPDNQLLLDATISDEGIGMSPEFQKIIFTPFSQEQRLKGGGGTGLGLSIVKKLLEQMGGTISVQSVLNKGTTFHLQVSFTCVEANPSITTTTAPKPVVETKLLQGKHVLLCEDHPLNREIALTLLKQKQMLVDTACDGGEAIDKFANSAPGFYDLILMDNRMPVLFGYEATVRIRALNRPDAKTVPIIAMTADAFSEDVKKALASGMNAHLSKPLNPEKMFATIIKILQK